MPETESSRRISAGTKTEAVLRVLRGEAVQRVAADLDVSNSAVERWKSLFVEAGTEGLRAYSERRHHRHGHRSSAYKVAVQWAVLLVFLTVTITLLLRYVAAPSAP